MAAAGSAEPEPAAGSLLCQTCGACPGPRARRGREERSRRSAGKELFVCPKPADVSSKPKVSPGGGASNVLRPQADSENEEPIGRRLRTIAAFLRKTKNCSAFGSQRSRSCTDPVEERAWLRVLVPPAAMLERGAAAAAGILLSSENSRRSASAPLGAADRRPAWRAVLTRRTPPAEPQRSVSPESNDSISEELNHFKPIVCSPCTPPKRHGRPNAIVKSTPRNLSFTARTTSYEANPAVLQKWRQIELDRQNQRVTSRATLTEPFHKKRRSRTEPDREAKLQRRFERTEQYFLRSLRRSRRVGRKSEICK